MKRRNRPLKSPNVTSIIILLFVFAIGVMMTLLFTKYNQYKMSQYAGAALKEVGNGAPSGPHYNLNIIGKEGRTCDNAVDNQGHRIFVSLTGRTKISLSQGDFNVLDYCGNDGQASFSLPSPDPNNDGVTDYTVWVRPLGKPGGQSQMTSCALDEYGIEWCSVDSVVSVRTSGKSRFTDVSRQLLYVDVDLNGDGVTERYPLFDPALQDYFWQYDNNGLKVLQMRFYQAE